MLYLWSEKVCNVWLFRSLGQRVCSVCSLLLKQVHAAVSHSMCLLKKKTKTSKAWRDNDATPAQRQDGCRKLKNSKFSPACFRLLHLPPPLPPVFSDRSLCRIVSTHLDRWSQGDLEFSQGKDDSPYHDSQDQERMSQWPTRRLSHLHLRAGDVTCHVWISDLGFIPKTETENKKKRNWCMSQKS